MDRYQNGPPRFSRRVLIGSVAAGLLTPPLVIGAHAQTTSLEALDAAGLMVVIRDSSDLSEANAALIEVFSRSGIAVFTDDGQVMMKRMITYASPLAFTETQVASMVEELRARSYRTIGEWNGFAPDTTETGEAMPTFADFYAGYGWGSTSPGADFARQLIWEMPIGNGWMSSAGLPAPRAAVALMSGEVLAGLQTQVIDLPTTVPGFPVIPDLPGLPQLPPLSKVYELPPLPELNDAACANVRTFVTTVSSVCSRFWITHEMWSRFRS